MHDISYPQAHQSPRLPPSLASHPGPTLSNCSSGWPAPSAFDPTRGLDAQRRLVDSRHRIGARRGSRTAATRTGLRWPRIGSTRLSRRPSGHSCRLWARVSSATLGPLGPGSSDDSNYYATTGGPFPVDRDDGHPYAQHRPSASLLRPWVSNLLQKASCFGARLEQPASTDPALCAWSASTAFSHGPRSAPSISHGTPSVS